MTTPTSVLDLANSVNFADVKSGILVVGAALILVAATIYGVRVLKGLTGGR
jgi:hypothetical protein